MYSPTLDVSVSIVVIVLSVKGLLLEVDDGLLADSDYPKEFVEKVVVPAGLCLLLILGVLLVLPEPVVVRVDDEPLVRLSEPSRSCGLSHHTLELKHAVERLCRYAHVAFLEQVGGGVQHRVHCSSVHDRWQLCRQAELVANLLRPSNLGGVVEVEGLDGPVGKGEVGLNLLVERCLLLAESILARLADGWENFVSNPLSERFCLWAVATDNHILKAFLCNIQNFLCSSDGVDGVRLADVVFVKS